MFTILDLLNHYIGFFTPNSKVKGRVYTLIAAVGVWYLLDLARRFFVNGHYFRAMGLAAVFVVLLYFTVLNVVYYFSDKTVKWDISPWIEKKVGEPLHDGRIEPTSKTVVMPAGGWYAQENVLPAEVILDERAQQNLTQLAEELTQRGLNLANYGDLSVKEQQQIVADKGVIDANYPGTLLPFFRLAQNGSRLVVIGGLNEMTAQNLGEITQIGLSPAAQISRDYDLALASVHLVGGAGKVLGRARLQETVRPYQLQVTVAYQTKKTTD